MSNDKVQATFHPSEHRDETVTVNNVTSLFTTDSYQIFEVAVDYVDQLDLAFCNITFFALVIGLRDAMYSYDDYDHTLTVVWFINNHKVWLDFDLTDESEHAISVQEDTGKFLFITEFDGLDTNIVSVITPQMITVINKLRSQHE